jgi:hypothetical protein
MDEVATQYEVHEGMIATDPPTRASVAELDQEFADTISEFSEWQLAQANSTLEDIGAALPRLAGRISARTLRIFISAVVPTDPDLDIVSVSALIARSFERVRQLCAAGVFGRKVAGKWRVGQRELEAFLANRRARRAGRPRRK